MGEPAASRYLGTKIKGASIVARLQHVRDRYGEEIVEQALDRVPEDAGEKLRGRMLPSSQYPLEIMGDLDEAIAAVLEAPDPIVVFRELGRASAEANLQTVHSTFVGGRTPHDVLNLFPAVRRTYYSDGEPSYERTGDNAGVFRVKHAKSHTLADCESTAGYFERAIELVGAVRGKVVLSRCRSKGDQYCEFSASWAEVKPVG